MILCSGWFDDVVSASVHGSSPFIVAVCRDLVQVGELVTWLELAVPLNEPYGLNVIAAHELDGFLKAAIEPRLPYVLLIKDATEGDTDSLLARWTTWNLKRDEMRAILDQSALQSRVIFLATRQRMNEVATRAPDLLSVADVITVDEVPFSVSTVDEAQMSAFDSARREMEGRFGMASTTFVDKLLRGESIEIPDPDRRRWETIVEALRMIESSDVSDAD